MSFDEAVTAMQARLGQKVRVKREPKGRAQSTVEGTLRPGQGFEEESRGLGAPAAAVPDEDGAWTFRVAPNAYWFRLHPQMVTGVQEESDRRRLRIELADGGAFVVERLGDIA